MPAHPFAGQMGGQMADIPVGAIAADGDFDSKA
jgi:hypothetical protein